MTDAFLDALEPQLAKFRDSRERREALALIKVVRLAPSLEVAEALLRGEVVPAQKFDRQWRLAYGRRS